MSRPRSRRRKTGTDAIGVSVKRDRRTTLHYGTLEKEYRRTVVIFLSTRGLSASRGKKLEPVQVAIVLGIIRHERRREN